MSLPQPTAFNALVHGYDGECPCCRRNFDQARKWHKATPPKVNFGGVAHVGRPMQLGNGRNSQVFVQPPRVDVEANCVRCARPTLVHELEFPTKSVRSAKRVIVHQGSVNAGVPATSFVAMRSRALSILHGSS